MEAKKYRAVDSNGNVFEVVLAKSAPIAKPAEHAGAEEFARAPEGNGNSRAQKVTQ